MGYDRFLIAPVNSGLQKDLPPWLLPEDAFQVMENALVWRGQIKKRWGSRYSGSDDTQNTSRLRFLVGVTDGAGNYSNTPAVPTVVSSAAGVGSLFSIGSAYYTVIVANGALLATQGSGTFNTTTAALTIAGAPATTQIYYYPSLPVMGLAQYELATGVGTWPAFAFDTRWAYQYNGTDWEVVDPTRIWKGTDLNYFWTSNWRGNATSSVYMFVTNFNATIGAPGATDDFMYTWSGSAWTVFTPYTNPAGGAPGTGPFVYTARIIFPFKGRLVLLNTIENDGAGGGGTNSAYPQRARWSYIGSPFATNAWYEWGATDNAGGTGQGASYVDAATKEQIIGMEFIKDRIIVYFEQSTYELVYTGNQTVPFVWQKINTELGAIGTFSTVPFDKAVLGIGKTGVHACSGSNVERIDEKIPDDIFFDFKIKDGAYTRTWGVRDYQPELVYWAFSESDQPATSRYNTRIMVYNYLNKTWAFYDDTVMCFGYFEQQSDLIWQNMHMTWEEAGFAWNANVEPAKARQVIFGNQQGFICVVDQDEYRNAGNLQISQLTNVSLGIWTLKIYNHNLSISGEYYSYVLLENMRGITINTQSDGIFGIVTVVDANTLTIATIIPGTQTDALSGVYIGGGTAALVSRVYIVSKQWSPYLKQGKDAYLAKILFAMQSTVNGSIQVDYMVDDSPLNMVDESNVTGTNSILGTNTLETFPFPGFDVTGTNRVWHPVYFQGQGSAIQIQIYLNDRQMIEADSSLVAIECQGLILLTTPVALRYI